jgi:hypothetical protein
VIRAANRAANDALPAEQPASAVPAKIEMRDEAVAIANKDDALAGYVELAIRAHLTELLDAPHAEPLIPEDCALLAREIFGVPIRLARERRLQPFREPLADQIVRRVR